MGTILTSRELNKLSELKRANQKLVLVGGCFDILHKGHIGFLKRAKELGDILVVLVESDQRVRKLKGADRPINTQEDRAAVLSNLSMVNAVICLKNLTTDRDYEALVKHIQPDIIAVTDSDRVFAWEKNYNVKILKKKGNYSTSKIIEKIRK